MAENVEDIVEKVLAAYEVPRHLERCILPVMTSVYESCDLPNIPPRSQMMIDRAEPRGWYALTPDGKLVLIRDGKVFDGPLDSSAIDNLKAEVEKEFPLVIFGCGIGHSVTQMRSFTNAPILIYEPDPGMARRLIGLGMPLPGVTITCLPDEFRELFPHFVQGKVGATLFATTQYVETYAEQFKSFEEIFRRILDAEKVTMDTIEFRMPEWIEHTLANLSALAGSRPAMRLAGALKGVPCFIVGAGPSLNRNGALLAEARRKGIVLTIDVAGKACQHFGCEPHGMITVEAKDMAKHFDNLTWMDHVPRLYSLACHPTAFRRGGGELVPWCDSNLPFRTLAEDVLNAEGLPLGGSCTTGAFLIAEAMGCNPIVMVGQDLVDSPPDEPNYCEGVERDMLPGKRGDFSTVLSWDGSREIPDQAIWRHARVWFEARAAWVHDRKPDIRLVNASEGGSHVDGWDHVPLSAVLAALPEQDIEATFRAAIAAVEPVTPEAINTWLNQQREMVGQLPALARDTATKSHRAAYMLSNGWEFEEAQAAIDDRNMAEMAFRQCAGPCVLFAGYTQPFIRAINESKHHGKELTPEDAAERITADARAFDQIAICAEKLLEKLNGTHA